jgi:hypothetical protein
MDEADLCAQFVSLTGTSPKEASNWLEMAGFELQEAIDLFFNSSGGQEEVVTQTSRQKGSYEDRFYHDSDDVRVPDEVKRQKLVDTDVYLGKRIYSGHVSVHSHRAALPFQKTK